MFGLVTLPKGSYCVCLYGETITAAGKRVYIQMVERYRWLSSLSPATTALGDKEELRHLKHRWWRITSLQRVKKYLRKKNIMKIVFITFGPGFLIFLEKSVICSLLRRTPAAALSNIVANLGIWTKNSDNLLHSEDLPQFVMPTFLLTLQHKYN